MKRFYEKSVEERRLELISEGMDADVLEVLAGPITSETAQLDRMSENVIGAWRLPLGVLRGLKVNGKEHCVPMATEEPSVIAAVNRASRLFRAAGGVWAECQKPSTMAQIMFTMHRDEAYEAARRIVDESERLLVRVNALDPGLIAAGGGAYRMRVETIRPRAEDLCPDDYMVVVYLDVYTADAMGANIVNTMAEAIQREIVQMFESQESFKRGMAIVSNAAPERTVSCSIHIERSWLEQYTHMDGAEFGERITRATMFAMRSPERAVTHHKGILNGIEAAALALGQDTRALHAAAGHSVFETENRLMSTWIWDAQEQVLKGQLKMPMLVGFAGKFRSHPAVDAAFKLANLSSYDELCGVLGAVGLAQNFGALWALVTEGIQQGHMRLHNRELFFVGRLFLGPPP